MVRTHRVPYGPPMNDTATPSQEQPPPLPPDDLPPAADTGTPPIVGGVAAALADGLGIDALWIRISFVLLALAGGLGLVVYGALWLVLVAGPSWGTPAPVIAGGAVLVIGLPILLGGFSLPQSVVVVALLAGVAVALWQPRPAVSSTPTLPPRPPADGSRFASRAEEARRRVRPPVRRRDPSPLGAITLGLAMVVGAGIALVDHINGGRLHPEVWHGVAAIVCGIGLLVGTVRGHARWLVVPALVLAAMGVVAGEMARLDIGVSDVTGDRHEWVWEDTRGPISARTGLGVVRVQIGAVPPEPVAVDARVAVGGISIDANDAVAVDVRRDGGAPERIGRQDGPADVVVDARVGIGDVSIGTWTEEPLAFGDDVATPELPEGLGNLSPITDVVAMTDDGWFVLADGEAVIDDRNRLAFGESWDDGDVTRLSTSYGEFTILPRGLLLTPDLEVIDLEAIRAEQVEAETTPQIDPSLGTIPAPPTADPQGDLP